MAWVVDSNVILDVARKDPAFGISSALYLEHIRAEGLVASPISLVELSPEFGGDIREERKFLRLCSIDSHTGWSDVDTERAATGWTRYVNLRHLNRVEKRPAADILIGAFACRFQGLITRNPAHFRPYFPGLKVRDPSPRK